MASTAMRRTADAAMARVASILTHVFFRHIEVEGADRLPRAGPAVVVANHANGLVDGLLLMATLRRYPRFLGKATLFRIGLLRPFLRLAGVVPVYRAADGEGTERNEATFRTCRDLLALGGVVALFPEGISHDEPALQPLRTGAARIALAAAADDATTGIVTVAVGLVYDAKARFRSRALVKVGTPHPVDPWTDGYRADAHDAVRRFTAGLTDQLHEVVTTYRSWREAEVLAAIADLVAAPAPGAGLDPPDGDVALADRERVAVALAAAGGAGRALTDAFGDYQRDLALLGLTDRQVTAVYGRRYHAAVGWSLFKVTAALIPAAAGLVVHIVPYQVMKLVAARSRNESVKATIKLLGCTASFTATYLGLAEWVRRRRGPVTAAAVLVAAPVSGYATLRLSERLRSVGGLMDGAAVVRSRRVVLPTVLAHRAEVVRLARLLVPAT